MPAAPAGFFLGYTTAPMRTLSPSLLFSLLAVAACRGGGDGGPDGPRGGDGPPNPDDTSIYDIQNPDGRVAEGTTLTIKGVVVTAIDTYAERADGTRKGNIWIEEPAGGAFSGVLVFGAPADQVANLHVGDVVDVAGASKTEFALGGATGDMTGRKTTELEPGDSGTILITVESTGGAPPAPELVDWMAIAQLDDSGTRPTARDNEFEKWEGVLIRVENVAQVSTVSLISGEANFQRFRISGGYEVDTSLAAFPAGADIDTCYASITGIGDYFFNWKILPRETSAIETGGTGCPAPEEGAGVCSNGMDDDYDGFADCADFSCQDTDPACVTTTSVADIQMGTVTGTVSLASVFVTGRDDIPGSRGVWVSDALQGAAYNGIYVYTGSGTLDPTLVVGATVSVTGNVQEFDTGTPAMGDTLTEIGGPAVVTLVSPAGGAPTPLTGVSAATLSDITTGEPYEGVLVQLTNVKVTNPSLGQGKVQLTDNNGDTIVMDDDAFSYPAQTMDTCYGTLTGLSSLQLIDDIRTIAPRSAADMVVGAGCN